MHRRSFLIGVVGATTAAQRRIDAAIDDAPVRAWVDRARALKTVTTDFRQERHLRTVTRPLVSPGRLWYRSDGALRWQLGDPPRTIALRPTAGAAITVIEPEEKTIRSFTAEEAGIKGGALALLDAGFPSSYDAFEKQFRVESVERDGAGAWRVSTQLRENALAIAVMKMVFVVDAETFQLRGIEVWLRDGSKIISLFENLKENAPVPDSLFVESTEGFREVR